MIAHKGKFWTTTWALAVGLVLLTAPTADAAAIWQTGTKTSKPDAVALNMWLVDSYDYGGTTCVGGGNDAQETTGGLVKQGDYIYVKDECKDGRSSVARVWDLNGNTSTRICRNPHGYGTWARCNFDWPEPAQYQFAAGVYDGGTGFLRFDNFEAIYFNG